MTQDATARLNLPYLVEGQAMKHLTLNEALAALDGLVCAAVQSRTLAAQPADPSIGHAWLLPAGRTGAEWTQHPPGTLMRWDEAGWTALAAPVGALAWAADEAQLLLRTPDGWRGLGEALGAVQGLARLGVGTTADAANPVAVKAGKVLLTARGAGEGGDGDLRLTLNKEAASDTASVLFQTGFSGRAEVGLTGGDALSVKLSADGAAWRETLTVASTGRVGVNQPAPTAVVDAVTEAPISLYNGELFADGTAGASFSGCKARGTRASPAGVQAGDRLTGVYGRGWHSGGALGGNTAALQLVAAETFTASAQGSHVAVETTPLGGTARRSVATFQANGAVRLVPLTAAPLLPSPGELYFDSTLGKFRGYTGSTWIDLH